MNEMCTQEEAARRRLEHLPTPNVRQSLMQAATSISEYLAIIDAFRFERENSRTK